MRRRERGDEGGVAEEVEQRDVSLLTPSCAVKA